MIKRVSIVVKWALSGASGNLMRLLYFNLFKKNTFLIYQMDLTNEIELFPFPLANFQVKLLKHYELSEFCFHFENPPRELFMHEIDGVEHAIAIFKDDQIAHISWIYLKGDRNRWFELADDEAQLNYSYTFTHFRGQGLFPHALLYAANWLQIRGFRRLWMEVHMETQFMMRSLQKVPRMQKVGTLTHWCIYRPKFR